MISPHRIKFNGYSSQDFDLICQLSFDGDSSGTDTFLGREAVASDNYRGTYKRVHNYKYTNVLTSSITLIDKNFGDFTLERQRRIFKWLTSKDTPSFLTVYHDDSEVISYEILGGITEIESYKLGNGRVIGIIITFESISPFAFSPLYTITKNVSSPISNTITINLDTDDAQSAVYPRITMKQDSTTSVVNINHAMTDSDRWVENTVYYYDTDAKYYWIDSNGVKYTSNTNDSGFESTSVSITNIYTDIHKVTRVFDTVVKNNIQGETIVLDGANRVVSSSRTNGRIFGDDFDWEWIPLFEGKNELSFTGNCTVTIEYRYPMKVGQF